MDQSILDAAPTLQSFAIFGLHGYKDVSIKFTSRAKIVVAENGTGKTTVLNALNAFLRLKFHRLAKLEFERIECEINDGQVGPIILKKSDLSQPEPRSDAFSELLIHSQTDQQQLIEYLLNEYSQDNSAEIRSHPIPTTIYQESPFTWEDVESHLAGAYKALIFSMPANVRSAMDRITASFGGIEILHLPTYRRIERPDSPRTKRSPFGQYPRPPRPRGRPAQPDEGQINFGLGDVQERLVELTEEIQRISTLHYRTSSAAIVDTLLLGGVDSGADEKKLPDVNSLQLFLSRVSGKSGQAFRRFSALNELYQSGLIKSEQHRPLHLFLSELGTIIDRTRDMEQQVQKFVDVSNEYLTLSSDEKTLRYDQSEMRVVVTNEVTGGPIDLDDLSSGEKQIISLMARLYLYDTKKIVLIDEPELSLSIDWQKRILPDVVEAPSCLQLLAITHSPFIFENELDSVAGPLEVVRHRGRARE